MEHWWRNMRLTLPTPLMLLTRHMLQADTKKQVAGTTTQVEFDASIQSLSALEAAAYRLIGTATCQIKRTDGRFICDLAVQSGKTANERLPDSPDALKSHFLYLVTDENLRARLAEKTEGMRNVILALAFGSLAGSDNTK
jgi:His-Xaa-Ser system protein HxsD